MPITGKQFELGIDGAIEKWMKKVHRFLSTHVELAYTAEELASELGGLAFPHALPGVVLPIQPPFAAALDKLAEVDAVEIRIVREQRYYRVGPRPLDL